MKFTSSLPPPLQDEHKHSLVLAKKIIEQFIEFKIGEKILFPESNIYIGDSLFITTDFGLQKNSINYMFQKQIQFDIVLTNPPYKNIKATTKEF